MNRRSLMNICLSYLVQGQEDQYLDLAKAQFEADQSYNDMISALSIISDTSNEPVKEDCLTQLYQQWKDNKLVMNSWINLKLSSSNNPLSLAGEIEKDPVFDITNPNKLRALIGRVSG
jgi:aminopeptidase N